jgi:xylulokinase
MNYLSIDVGTTGCKCQLFSSSGEILKYLFSEYDFKIIDGKSYVNVDLIMEHLSRMISETRAEHEISSVCVSSLGESFVLLDEEDRVIFYPMLYTDPRGESEAEEIRAKIGEEKVFSLTGAMPHSMYSISKLLYIKNNYPEIFCRAKRVMLIGDYVGYLLTGKRVIDYALASRTGAFDIEKKEFSREILDAFGISAEMFSTPMPAGSIVGKLLPEWGTDAVLVLGSHDQVCAALGAGAIRAGDAADGMGTVECITALFEKKPTDPEMGRQGYACVPYPVDGLFCTYVLNYSCGSAVNWLRKKIMHGYRGSEADFFAYIEKGMTDAPTGILALPYFGGAGTPHQDLSARAAFIGITAETRDSELYKSLMEGTAFEMRFNAEIVKKYGISLTNIVATGGGANSEKWLRLKADIQGLPVKTLRSSEGGLCGCAMLSAVALGDAANLGEARECFVRYTREYTPDEKGREAYEPYYEKYKKLYHTLKEFN